MSHEPQSAIGPVFRRAGDILHPPTPPQGEQSVVRPVPIQRFSKLAHPFLETSLLLCVRVCEGRRLK